MYFLTWTIAFDVFIHKNTQIMPFNIKRERFSCYKHLCECVRVYIMWVHVCLSVYMCIVIMCMCACVCMYCAQNRCHYVTLCACIRVSVCVKACVNGCCTLCTTWKMKVIVCIWCVRCIVCSVVCCVVWLVCCVVCCVVCYRLPVTGGVLHARCDVCSDSFELSAVQPVRVSESFLLIFLSHFISLHTHTHTECVLTVLVYFV